MNKQLSVFLSLSATAFGLFTVHCSLFVYQRHLDFSLLTVLFSFIKGIWILHSSFFTLHLFYSPITDFSTQYAKIPAMYPMKAIQVMFFMYQPKVIFSSPMTTTPAAEPMMSIEPPTPAQ